ncbi:hypothetical protein [Bacillus methanolicus]|uniref:Transposase IS204/IS1001/IS1096/IS1165 zinc-finger domain-containing protein n=1 Tax=Bacillus methanolicus (strain MGA3 / ATCC 53907) TaxID=796606 RepID=I3E374_BACMM|nr:hypothetical protein [Bacillus methanolicus]AIE58963.1 hypothetical protein BMMGA3_02495 [Bacillus methanolicus MGA3]EIJ80945.1 transposase IS204/IS1001/IS1096/IS1165 family protein [Bacillus methanolicus MGA3]UQD51031.1 hypothetical protein C0971_02575 [Bacillus methanolicus]
MFSVSLDLPEFEVVKQVFLEDCNLLHVEKNSTKERCPYCAFLTSNVHDLQTIKVLEKNVKDYV